MRISDWISDGCSSDLYLFARLRSRSENLPQARGDQQKPTARLQRVFALFEGRDADRVANDVIGSARPPKVLFGVVDCPIGADRMYEIQIGGAAHARHHGAEMLGEIGSAPCRERVGQYV